MRPLPQRRDCYMTLQRSSDVHGIGVGLPFCSVRCNLAIEAMTETRLYRAH